MAWTLKRLMSCFNRVIARPHRPRSEVIRGMMQDAGIPIPEASPTDQADSEDDYIGEEDGEEEERCDDDEVVEAAPPDTTSALVPDDGPAKAECPEEPSCAAPAECQTLALHEQKPEYPEPKPLACVSTGPQEAPAENMCLQDLPKPEESKPALEVQPRPLKRLKQILEDSAKRRKMNQKPLEGAWA